MKLKGSVFVERILTREEAAKQMDPPVTVRMLQKYLYLAALYLPEFEIFLDTENGGLDRNVKLTNYHIPALQHIRSSARKLPLKKVAIQLANSRCKSA